MAHRHKAKRTKERCWSGCVAPRDCNGAAHGNITQEETCACGHTRRVEVNQHHSVASQWTPPTDEPPHINEEFPGGWDD